MTTTNRIAHREPAGRTDGRNDRVAHTPGPWEIVHQTQDGHLGSYCDLKHSIRYDGGQFSIGQRIQDTQEGYVIGQSRARLIAAAPELLRSLEAMVDASCEQDLTALAMRIDRARQDAEAAIQKARGGQ